MTGVREMYNKRAPTYERETGSRYNKTLGLLLRWMPLSVKPSKILDMGCGTGVSTAALAKRFAGADILGMDISEEMLKLCRQKVPNLDLVVGDFNSPSQFYRFSDGRVVKFPQSYFDLVVSTGAVSEYGDLPETMPYIYSLLKDGGVFVNVGVKESWITDITSRLWRYKTKSPKRFMQACTEAGFSKVSRLRMPWDIRLFPTNLMKYIVQAEK